MNYKVEIIFGKEQVLKHQRGESFTAFENQINRKYYDFETLQERNAFYKGLGETVGWTEFEVINELQTKLVDIDRDKNSFNYWDFIVKYYPNFDHCDNILLSDILSRKLNGEEICESDEEYIKDWDVRNELMKLDKKLLGKAFENYFNSIYPNKK